MKSVIEFDFEIDGDRLWESHYNEKNQLHRNKYPAYIAYTNNVPDYARYYLRGRSLRLDGPQSISYEHGTETYIVFGDQLSKEQYWEIINSHKENLEEYLFGDIIIKYKLPSKYISENHYSNGRLHSLTGEAEILYNVVGHIERTGFYLFDIHIPTKEEYDEIISTVPLELMKDFVNEKYDCPHCLKIDRCEEEWDSVRPGRFLSVNYIERNGLFIAVSDEVGLIVEEESHQDMVNAIRGLLPDLVEVTTPEVDFSKFKYLTPKEYKERTNYYKDEKFARIILEKCEDSRNGFLKKLKNLYMGMARINK